jgi:hypothetical protein
MKMFGMLLEHKMSIPDCILNLFILIKDFNRQYLDPTSVYSL